MSKDENYEESVALVNCHMLDFIKRNDLQDLLKKDEDECCLMEIGRLIELFEDLCHSTFALGAGRGVMYSKRKQYYELLEESEEN